MRTFVVPTMVAALLATASMAFAAEQATGTIKSIDMSTHMLTLSDGMAFKLGTGVSDKGLKTGEKVQVSYNTTDGNHTAMSVKKVQ
jgi:Cu/Ag efflux protein CusF